MSRVVGRLVSTWKQVMKRGLAHWRLLSFVILGVVLASAIMSGTVVYFDALREMALKRTLDKHPQNRLDILIEGSRGPTSAREYEKVRQVAMDQIDNRVGWLLSDRIHAGKSETFFLTVPGEESAAGQDNARAYFAFMPRLAESVTYLDGEAPSGDVLNAPGELLAIEASVPSDAARFFGLNKGSRMLAVPFWDAEIPYVTVVISGVFERNDPKANLWQLEQRVLQAATGPSFRTLPFHISEETYLEVLGPSLRKLDSTYAWLLIVDTGRIHARNANSTLARLMGMHRELNAVLSGYSQRSFLDEALREYDRRLFFSKLPMFVVLVLIAIVILYYVATLSSMVVEERRSDVALLRSRGATPPQILTVFVLEGLTISVLASVLGPLIAAVTISLLGYTPAFSDLTGDSKLAVDLSRGAYLMSSLGGLLGFVALILPAVQASHIGVTQHRLHSARPTQPPAFQRYYLDVGMLIIGIFLFRQLSEQGSVVATRLLGDVVVDQLLLAVPGLLLLSSAMVLLRLFPLVMGLMSRGLSRVLPVGLMMGVWQMARNPTHYARLSLLLILTAGLGVFASSFGSTLERSFEERVLYSTGSDIRVDGIRQSVGRVRSPYGASIGSGGYLSGRWEVSRSSIIEDFQNVPGVEMASPVLRAMSNDLSRGLIGDQFTTLAVDASTFNTVAWFRDDFSRRPLGTMLEDLRVPDPPAGIALPRDAFGMGMRVKADRPHPTVRVTVRVRNAQGRHTTFVLGTLDSNDWMEFETVLPTTSARFSHPLWRSMPTLHQPLLPLRLVSIRVHEHQSPQLQGGSIIIDDLWVDTPHGRETIDAFDDTEGWRLLKGTPDAAADVLRASTVGFDGGSGAAIFTWTHGASRMARGIFAGSKWNPIPVLASTGFMDASHHVKGDFFEILAGNSRVPVEIVDTVDFFPTMTRPNDKYLIADLGSLTRFANMGTIFGEIVPTEVWISTSATGNLRERLIAALEYGHLNLTTYQTGPVYDRARFLAESEADPLVEAGWRALLFIAFGTVLVLSCGGFLVHSYVSLRNRRGQFALLRTIGFSMRQLSIMLWFEQVLVIGVGMALGTWMGGRLGATIMPFLGNDDQGGQVMPPFVMDTNWGVLLFTYAVMALAFAVISFGIILIVQRISLQRVLRLGEM